MGLSVADQPPDLDPPTMRQKLHWSHEKENDCGGTSAGAEVQGWESAVWRTAWPEGRVSARSAFQMPVASLLGRNGHTPPGRSHRGQDTAQRWTCLGGRVERSDEECKYNGCTHIRLQKTKHGNITL